MLNDGALCVDKSGPKSASYGEAVAYQMAVTYSSLDGSPAQNIGVVDDIYGASTYASGDTDGDGYLDISETWHYTTTGAIGEIAEVGAGPVVNVATVSGEDSEGAVLTPATDTHATAILLQEIYLPLIKGLP
jgi:hypothetical protein